MPRLRQILNKYIDFNKVYYEACITGAGGGRAEAFESYEFNIFDTASLPTLSLKSGKYFSIKSKNNPDICDTSLSTPNKIYSGCSLFII